VTDLPWLLGPGARRSNPADLGRCSLRCLGETAASLPEHGIEPIALMADFYQSGGPSAEIWFAALARELTLLSRTQPELVVQAQLACGPASSLLMPFPDGPPMGEFLGQDPAAVLIPVATPNGERAAFAQVWAFNKHAWPDWKQACERCLDEPAGLDSLAAGQLGILVLPPTQQKLVGTSWQLAAALAIEFSQNENGAAIQLARRWVVTGAVDEGPANIRSRSVLQVSLACKRQLAREVLQRNWLVPAGNLADVTPEWEAQLAGRLYYARDVESAMAQIEGRGYVSGENLDWNVADLTHPVSAQCFASDALGPMLATFLWTQPAEIRIWTSATMAGAAGQLRKACLDLREEYLPSIPSDDAIEVVNIDDNDLLKIRRTLLEDPHIGEGLGPSLFNLTGGNLLMRVALLDLARLRPKLAIVYRSENAQALDFVCIRHPFLQPVVSTIHFGNEIPGEPANWQRLLSLHFRNENIQPEGRAEALIGIVRKNSPKKISEALSLATFS
jgi:hypothetical protein